MSACKGCDHAIWTNYESEEYGTIGYCLELCETLYESEVDNGTSMCD